MLPAVSVQGLRRFFRRLGQWLIGLPKRRWWPRWPDQGLTIFVRIWAAFAVLMIIGGIGMVNALQTQLRPSAKEVVEDTLADNAQLVANLIANDVASGRVKSAAFDRRIQEWLTQPLPARIGPVHKLTISQQLYITNAKGIVIYDSQHQAEGQDYSRWRDVYLTLRGRYGARATRVNPADESTSSMYVAAPIRYQDKIIGVVTLIKPGRSLQAFITQAERALFKQVLQIGLAALIVAAAVALWLRNAIEQVRRFALPEGDRQTRRPRFRTARELNELGKSIEEMRQRLAGKAYVEQTMQTLTHELKSPLTAITASAELLQDELPAEDREHFASSISAQAARLTHLVEQMLLLSRAEQHFVTLEQVTVNLGQLINELIDQRQALGRQKQVMWTCRLAVYEIIVDRFWFAQLLGNLLDNALDFMQVAGEIAITSEQFADSEGAWVVIMVSNTGETIPDYALARVAEAYFSLPRPHTEGRRSSGLGLTLVDRIVQLHQGQWRIENRPENDGVIVTIRLPITAAITAL